MKFLNGKIRRSEIHKVNGIKFTCKLLLNLKLIFQLQNGTVLIFERCHNVCVLHVGS